MYPRTSCYLCWHYFKPRLWLKFLAPGESFLSCMDRLKIDSFSPTFKWIGPFSPTFKGLFLGPMWGIGGRIKHYCILSASGQFNVICFPVIDT